MAPALTAAHLGTALIVILALCLGGADAVSPEGPDIPFGSGMFWIYVGICAVLTVFGGMCSGLSMGLLSQESLHLEVLSKSDDPTVAKHATAIQRLVKRRHLVLVTLLLANSAAMEALPLFLDRLTLAYIAIIISVTVVLMFGEILPSAICSKWGLAISYHMRYVVWAMIFVCLPIAWPISKALDLMLGADHSTYYRRSELKHFVVAHAQPEAEAETHAGLTQEETQIISGAIDLRDKTVKDCLQPLDKVFCIDINRVLDLPTLSELVKVGHSRVPVYDGERDNIVGLLRVKHLIIINPSVPTTVRQQQLYPIPRVNADRALYDMLQYFRTGRSHMVLVEERPSGKVLGIVTLEDLIEELLQAEIKGEEEILFFRSQSNLMRSQSLRTVRSHPKSGDPRSLQRDTGRSFVVPRQQRDESRGRTRVDDVIIPINSEGSERTPLLSQSVPPSPATSAPRPAASVAALRAQKTVSFIA